MVNVEDRLATALHNLRDTRAWRPFDWLNWSALMWPLRGAAPIEPQFRMGQLAFDLATRTAFTYRPHPVRRFRRPVNPDRMLDIAASYTRGELRVGLFVDSMEHVSGVSTTISSWAAHARARELDIQLHTSGFECVLPGAVCFPPVGTVHLSSYAGLPLHMPFVQEALDFVRRESFDVIHLSTPGPMGLLGLIAAREQRIPICGTFHTDFPRYARAITGSAELESAAWAYMRWFYGHMTRIAAPSSATRDDLVRNGLDSARICVVGRGVDVARYHPSKRTRTPDGRFRLLYVGRLSNEKNLDVLVEAFRALRSDVPDAELHLVGDGPARERLERDVAGPVVFHGLVKGEALARLYADADLFVFPSETDTLGVVLLEAQASGLPVIASSRGGPRDVVDHGETGWLLDSMNPATLAQAIRAARADSGRLADMRRKARALAESRTPASSFDAFWSMHREAAAAARPSAHLKIASTPIA